MPNIIFRDQMNKVNGFFVFSWPEWCILIVGLIISCGLGYLALSFVSLETSLLLVILISLVFFSAVVALVFLLRARDKNRFDHLEIFFDSRKDVHYNLNEIDRKYEVYPWR